MRDRHRGAETRHRRKAPGICADRRSGGALSRVPRLLRPSVRPSTEWASRSRALLRRRRVSPMPFLETGVARPLAIADLVIFGLSVSEIDATFIADVYRQLLYRAGPARCFRSPRPVRIRLISGVEFVVLRAPNFRPNPLIYRALHGNGPGVSRVRPAKFIVFLPGSIDLDELLQAPEAPRQLLALGTDAASPIGERHLADIDVAVPVDGEPVRRDELARVEPGMRVAEAR
jgi:hypothetical protein